MLEPLALALEDAKNEIRTCSRCGAYTVSGRDPCDMCTDALRDSKTLCVVEDAADIVLIESSGAFKGRYHSLGGKLAPSRKMPPERLRFDSLLERVRSEGFTEVLLALSTDMEGDATALYAAGVLKPAGVKVTRLAFGLPADSGVAYSDALTLRRAIQWRRDV